MVNKLSPDGESQLIKREGKRNKAYKDTKGIWTIGVGHTGPHVYEGLAWTDQQIMDAFRADIKWAEDAVNKVVTPLQQHQFDALVSFVFNIGATGFARSTCLKKLNMGLYDEAAVAMMMWVKPPELYGRRLSEHNQFLGK